METVKVHPILEYDETESGKPNVVKHLLFIHDEEDGLIYNGVIEALKEYCDEMGCEVGEVNWQVQPNPSKYTFCTIRAKTFDEWKEKFNKLNVKWE